LHPSLEIAVVTLLLLVIIGKRGKEIAIKKTLFTIGLPIVGIAVVLLLMDMIEFRVAEIIGIVGIGLIATSGRLKMKRMR
jgi:hypothetical protein